ncbi:BZ3500_MvSof-1268-A1-R1_Chr6-3g08857 [Microbotryum saponariae]|uniref:BZ3500_MvSof-1268-A1-R1_Chr6-3g08857 protein n=1 Tax=Microbotryum saponariae TaxID=289078 RepID=A0A2X0LPX1_9BASI|nr:BZ3500_MvSof-1268-A1-R1_Chr6-3g08857 [Microbotryum saponariae]SDA07458.1 BZ3501_MvSof-1269-A2-R1_Chr6-2g08560 [Microbotryum saponariae]
MTERFLDADVPSPFSGATDDALDFSIPLQGLASPASAQVNASTLIPRAEPFKDHDDHDDHDAGEDDELKHNQDHTLDFGLDTALTSAERLLLAHPEEPPMATAPGIVHELEPHPPRQEELLRPKIDLLEAHSDIFTGSTLSPIPSTPAATAENSDGGAATTSSLKRRASSELPLPTTSSGPGASLPLEPELDATSDELEDSPMHRAAKSASQWNSLLRWARHQRGPQWDYATGQYHVDRSTPEYYAGVERSTALASALPSHISHNASGGASPAFSGPGTPAHEVAGVYDSGRPRRTRAGAR